MSAVRDDTFGCLLWPHVDRDGYGRIGRQLAHRKAYEEAYGPIGDGLFIDHMCRRRNCIAPHHLEAVDQAENERRKQWRWRAKRKACPRGHDLGVNAVVTNEGGRVCRQCNREAKERT